jgi:A1 cistron-splicing factor AAR2
VPNGQTFSTRSVGRDRTEQAMDASSHIEDIVARYCTYEDSDEIIGELQFCYITGMTLGNVACQEQWAVIVKKLFRAYKLALTQPVFLRKAIEALHAQLMYDDVAFENCSIFDVESGLRKELKNILITFKVRAALLTSQSLESEGLTQLWSVSTQ